VITPKNILEQNDLTEPDGRPLHAYRISEIDHDFLQLGLLTDIGFASINLPWFAASFAIWAAEHFRRNFDGGSFQWEFLFDALESPVDDQLGRDLAQKGLKYWKRPIARNDGNHRLFLQTLIAEGGLPNKLISRNSKYRSVPLAILRDLEGDGAVQSIEIAEEIAGFHGSSLPTAFRSAEFYSMLALFAVTVADLRQKLPRDLAPSLKEKWLDQNIPEWRASLPLPLDSDAAKTLLSDAIREDRIKVVSQNIFERYLTVSEQGKLSQKVEFFDHSSIRNIDFPFATSELKSFRLKPSYPLSDAVPRLLIGADLNDQGPTSFWDLRRLSGSREAFAEVPLDMPISFHGTANGSDLGIFWPTGGEPIDIKTTPTFWVQTSSLDGNEGMKLRFLGSGSQALSESQVFLLVTSADNVRCTKDLNVACVSKGERYHLYSISGDGKLFFDEAGSKYSIKTGLPEGERHFLISVGERILSLKNRLGDPLYKGFPTFLGRKGGSGHNVPVPISELFVRKISQKDWEPAKLADLRLGDYSVEWRQGGDVLHRMRVTCVPATFVLEAKSIKNGGITTAFQNLPANVEVEIKAGTKKVKDRTSSSILNMTMVEQEKTPDTLEITFKQERDDSFVFAKGNYPFFKGDFVDPQRNRLMEEIEVSIFSLAGWRILMPPNSSGQLQITLLSSESNFQNERNYVDVSHEVSLSTFMILFKQILALGGPDAKLRLSVLCNGQQSRRLTLTKYQTQLLRDGTEIYPSKSPIGKIRKQRLENKISPFEKLKDLEIPTDTVLENDDSIQIGAVNLWQPEYSIECQTSEFPFDLAKNCNIAGPHLIYTSRGKTKYRPFIVDGFNKSDISNKVGFSKEMREISQMRNRDERITGFAKILRERLSDVEHPDWEQFGHLIDIVSKYDNLGSLDQIQALAKDSSAVILLLLKASEKNAPLILSLEEESGFSWVSTKIDDWHSVTKAITSSLENAFILAGFSEIEARIGSFEWLKKRLDNVVLFMPALKGHTLLALHGNLSEVYPNSERDLFELAQDAVKKQSAKDQSFSNVMSKRMPSKFDNFHRSLLGYLCAPIVAAEIALGLRNGKSLTTKLSIIHFRNLDPTYFEKALPLALTYLMKRA